eukprot:Selendium_serpulae@DN6459_c0_g1_i10.p3
MRCLTAALCAVSVVIFASKTCQGVEVRSEARQNATNDMSYDMDFKVLPGHSEGTVPRVHGIEFINECPVSLDEDLHIELVGNLWCNAAVSIDDTREASYIHFKNSGRVVHSILLYGTRRTINVNQQHAHTTLWTSPIVYRSFPFDPRNIPLPVSGFDDLYPWLELDTNSTLRIEITRVIEGFKLVFDRNTETPLIVDDFDSYTGVDEIVATCFRDTNSHMTISGYTQLACGAAGTGPIVGGEVTSDSSSPVTIAVIGTAGVGLLLALAIAGVIYSMKAGAAADGDSVIADGAVPESPEIVTVLNAAGPAPEELATDFVNIDPDCSFWGTE